MDREEALRRAQDSLEAVAPDMRVELDAIIANFADMLEEEFRAGVLVGVPPGTVAMPMTLTLMAMVARDPKWAAKMVAIAEMMPTFHQRVEIYRERLDRRP